MANSFLAPKAELAVDGWYSFWYAVPVKRAYLHKDVRCQ